VRGVCLSWRYSCVEDVRIGEIHPEGRHIKLQNTSQTQVSCPASGVAKNLSWACTPEWMMTMTILISDNADGLVA